MRSESDGIAQERAQFIADSKDLIIAAAKAVKSETADKGEKLQDVLTPTKAKLAGTPKVDKLNVTDLQGDIQISIGDNTSGFFSPVINFDAVANDVAGTLFDCARDRLEGSRSSDDLSSSHSASGSRPPSASDAGGSASGDDGSDSDGRDDEVSSGSGSYEEPDLDNVAVGQSQHDSSASDDGSYSDELEDDLDHDVEKVELVHRLQKPMMEAVQAVRADAADKDAKLQVVIDQFKNKFELKDEDFDGSLTRTLEAEIREGGNANVEVTAIAIIHDWYDFAKGLGEYAESDLSLSASTSTEVIIDVAQENYEATAKEHIGNVLRILTTPKTSNSKAQIETNLKIVIQSLLKQRGSDIDVNAENVTLPLKRLYQSINAVVWNNSNISNAVDEVYSEWVVRDILKQVDEDVQIVDAPIQPTQVLTGDAAERVLATATSVAASPSSRRERRDVDSVRSPEAPRQASVRVNAGAGGYAATPLALDGSGSTYIAGGYPQTPTTGTPVSRRAKSLLSSPSLSAAGNGAGDPAGNPDQDYAIVRLMKSFGSYVYNHPIQVTMFAAGFASVISEYRSGGKYTFKLGGAISDLYSDKAPDAVKKLLAPVIEKFSGITR